MSNIKSPKDLNCSHEKYKRQFSYHFWFGFNVKIYILFIFVHQKSLKWKYKPKFWVQNHFLNLRSRVVNSQSLFGCQKMFVFKFSGIQKIVKILVSWLSISNLLYFVTH